MKPLIKNLNVENSSFEGWQTQSNGVFSGANTKTPVPTPLCTPQEENLGTEVKKIPLVKDKGEADGAFKAKFMKYSQLPYNPKLKEKAKQLRKARNLSEVLFWNAVKNKQLRGLDFERQKIIGNYIVDFYCPELGLVVEIDGQSHDFEGEYDQNREKFLVNLDLEVIHYSDLEIKKGLDVIMRNLYNYLQSKQGQNLEYKEEKTPRQPTVVTPHEGNFAHSESITN